MGLQTSMDERKLWVEALQKSGLISRCVEWWAKLYRKDIFDKKQEDLMRNFRMMVGSLWNTTEISDNSSQDFTNAAGFLVLLKSLDSPQLTPQKLREDKSNVSRLYVAHSIGAILLNVLRRHLEAKSSFRDAQGLKICQRFLHSSLDIIKCKFLLCLAYAINEEENESILGETGTTKFL